MGQQGLMSNMMMTHMLMAPGLNQLMVPAFPAPQELALPQPAPPDDAPADDGFNLYLCKTDFKPYSSADAEFVKNFIISEIVRESDEASGWAPDLTLKGLQSTFRYQVHTTDERSKDWLLGLDFAGMNVLAYTKEELWYERAAVWLPGHSRCRNIEPLDKLRLQNRRLAGVDLHRWKFVRKIVTPKGTRLYVDMPPAAARALEAHGMLLSYELQKVSVFLKAVAVDQDAFDAGLREPSACAPADLAAAAQAAPMPALPADPAALRVSLHGCRALTVDQARKIREIIIYKIFKHHQDSPDGCRTDFVRHGLLAPDGFGVVPENEESRRWLAGLSLGRMNKRALVVRGGEALSDAAAVALTASVPRRPGLRAQSVLDQMRRSTGGIPGLHVGRWRAAGAVRDVGSRCLVPLRVDLDSAEALLARDLRLEYEDERLEARVAEFRPDGPVPELRRRLERLRAEERDSYDVANMDISQSGSEDDDIVCMGEV